MQKKGSLEKKSGDLFVMFFYNLQTVLTILTKCDKILSRRRKMKIIIIETEVH